MNQDIAKFYQVVRSNQALIATLTAGKNFDEIMDAAVAHGKTHGFSFTKEEAMAVAGDIGKLRANLINDDELNDFDLEMVSAGAGLDEVKHHSAGWS